jgi:osmoprotectant transport system permease protein
MRFVADVVRWFTDQQHWYGSAGFPHRLWEHVELCALAVVCACALAIPAGIALGHVRRGGVVAVGVVNIGRALPSFGVIAIALPISIRLGLGLGFWPTFFAVFVLALPPIFTNSYTGVRQVDPAAVDAARGMGLKVLDVLLRVELPLASPVILASVRVAAVQVVATAPLGALVAWGGLGRFIVDGFAQLDQVQAAAGAVLVALLAIATEIGFAAAERFLLPRGIRRMALADAAAMVGRAA